MKNEPIFDDDAEEYFNKNKSKKKEKTDEEILDEEIYNRRCKLVKYAHSDYFKFKEYLLNNESFFKSKMAQPDKECMRRTCQTAYDNAYSAEYEDIQIFDRIFGRYIDPRKSETIPTTERHEPVERKMTIEEEIEYRSRGSYYAMWDFISNPEWQERLKGREDLYDKVKYMIERAKENNDYVTVNMKRYEPSDEDMYVKVLNMMKEEKK